MEKLVSIIVPVYKVEDYLKRCVDSILNQQYKNLEVILVDDGSPDRCGEMCEEYKARDDRVVVIHKKNGGLSDARNAGIDIAKGEFISFVDSDDWIHQSYIKTLYELLENRNADIAVCAYQKTHDYTTSLPEEEFAVHEFSNVEALAQLFDEFYTVLVVAWGKLYKRELFQEIRYPKDKLHEDEFTSYKLLYLARKIVLTTAPMLFYFQRDDSIMGGGEFSISRRIALLEALNERSLFYQNVGLSDYANRTDKMIFRRIFRIDKQLEGCSDRLKVVEIKDMREKLKVRLRNGKHNIKFRCFFELYYLMPLLFGFIYR